MHHKNVNYDQLIKNFELQEEIIQELSAQLLEVDTLEKVKKISAFQIA